MKSVALSTLVLALSIGLLANAQVRHSDRSIASQSLRPLVWGTFSNSLDVSDYAANAPKTIEFDTVDGASGITVENLTDIVVSRDAVIEVTAQPQVRNPDAQQHRFDIWVERRVGGVWSVVPDSTAYIEMTLGSSVLPVSFIIEIGAGDAFRIASAVDSAFMLLDSTTGLAGSAPNAPSIILTAKSID